MAVAGFAPVVVGHVILHISAVNRFPALLHLDHGSEWRIDCINQSKCVTFDLRLRSQTDKSAYRIYPSEQMGRR